MGLKSCFLQVGGVSNCVVYSDRGSNLIPLMKLDAEERGEAGVQVDEEERPQLIWWSSSSTIVNRGEGSGRVPYMTLPAKSSNGSTFNQLVIN